MPIFTFDSARERLLMPPTKSRLAAGVVLAVVGPIVASLVAQLPAMERFDYISFLLAVILATIVGRLGAALLATLVSVALLDYFVVPPTGTLNPERPEDLIQIGVFLVVSVVLAEVLARRDQILAQAQRSNERLRFLAQAGDLFLAELDHREALRKLADYVVPHIADWCAIHLLDDSGSIEPLAVAHVDPAKVELAQRLQREYPTDPDDMQGVANVIRTGRSEMQRELTDAVLERLAQGRERVRIIRSLGLRSYLIAPITVEGRAIGAITLVNAESSRLFDDADLILAEQLGRRAGLAIENTRLYETQRHIATTLQRGLLPKAIPDIPGIGVAARYWPYGTGLAVGGDFYDVFGAGDDRWTGIVGDVCGKGPEAAVVMGIVRQTARALGPRDATPSDLVRSINQALLDSATDGRFCTACVIRLARHGDDVRVTVAAGGHPLPLLLTADGRASEVGQPGTLLGVFEDVEVSDQVLDLDPGDALIMYTDGLTELRSAEQQELDLRALLEKLPAHSADRLAEAVEAAIPRESLRDDGVLLIFRRDSISRVQEQLDRVAGGVTV